MGIWIENERICSDGPGPFCQCPARRQPEVARTQTWILRVVSRGRRLIFRVLTPTPSPLVRPVLQRSKCVSGLSAVKPWSRAGAERRARAHCARPAGARLRPHGRRPARRRGGAPEGQPDSDVLTPFCLRLSAGTARGRSGEGGPGVPGIFKVDLFQGQGREEEGRGWPLLLCSLPCQRHSGSRVTAHRVPRTRSCWLDADPVDLA